MLTSIHTNEDLLYQGMYENLIERTPITTGSRILNREEEEEEISTG